MEIKWEHPFQKQSQWQKTLLHKFIRQEHTWHKIYLYFRAFINNGTFKNIKVQNTLCQLLSVASNKKPLKLLGYTNPFLWTCNLIILRIKGNISHTPVGIGCKISSFFGKKCPGVPSVFCVWFSFRLWNSGSVAAHTHTHTHFIKRDSIIKAKNKAFHHW